MLERCCAVHRRPAAITMDTGPEFDGLALDAWAYREGVHLDCIEPGRPMQNRHLERCNGEFRDACRNQHWFTDLNDARETIAAWRDDDPTVRPHSALGESHAARFRAAARATGKARSLSGTTSGVRSPRPK